MAFRPLNTVPYILKLILSKHDGIYSGIDLIIETGTWEGHLTETLAGCFDKVITIELNEFYFNHTKGRLKNIHNITFHHGDSSVILPEIIKTTYTPAIFYLDAHYCNTGDPQISKCKFPLWSELLTINKHRNDNDIVIIDDVHTFNIDRPDLKFNKNDLEWESVNQHSISQALGERVKDIKILEDICVVYMEKMNFAHKQSPSKPFHRV